MSLKQIASWASTVAIVVASWASTVAIVVALWLLVAGLIESKDVAVALAHPGVFGAAILSAALSLWTPPAVKSGK